MTPAEEDALVALHANDCIDNPNAEDVRDSFRLAIRAAVAHERERAAREADPIQDDEQDESAVKVRVAVAAAIRRGED